MQGQCLLDIKKFIGHKNSPPMCETRDCKVGEKILCNRCPLKHEAQERGRGEMLYENTFDQKPVVEKYVNTNTIDISNT